MTIFLMSTHPQARTNPAITSIALSLNVSLWLSILVLIFSLSLGIFFFILRPPLCILRMTLCRSEPRSTVWQLHTRTWTKMQNSRAAMATNVYYQCVQQTQNQGQARVITTRQANQSGNTSTHPSTSGNRHNWGMIRGMSWQTHFTYKQILANSSCTYNGKVVDLLTVAQFALPLFLPVR